MIPFPPPPPVSPAERFFFILPHLTAPSTQSPLLLSPLPNSCSRPRTFVRNCLPPSTADRLNRRPPNHGVPHPPFLPSPRPTYFSFPYNLRPGNLPITSFLQDLTHHPLFSFSPLARIHQRGLLAFESRCSGSSDLVNSLPGLLIFHFFSCIPLEIRFRMGTQSVWLRELGSVVPLFSFSQCVIFPIAFLCYSRPFTSCSWASLLFFFFPFMRILVFFPPSPSNGRPNRLCAVFP